MCLRFVPATTPGIVRLCLHLEGGPFLVTQFLLEPFSGLIGFGGVYHPTDEAIDWKASSSIRMSTFLEQQVLNMKKAAVRETDECAVQLFKIADGTGYQTKECFGQVCVLLFCDT